MTYWLATAVDGFVYIDLRLQVHLIFECGGRVKEPEVRLMAFTELMMDQVYDKGFICQEIAQ